MATNRRRYARTRRAQNAREREPWADFCAEFLATINGEPFDVFNGDVEAAEAYWADFGPELTAEWAARQPGTRPDAWWHYDSPEPIGDDEQQAAYLDRLGLLSPAERLALSLDPPAPLRGPHARRR